jgi:hypothetical protein
MLSDLVEEHHLVTTQLVSTIPFVEEYPRTSTNTTPTFITQA